jgi:hypothetical protein
MRRRNKDVISEIRRRGNEGREELANLHNEL